jgi:hypothetical protein
MQKLGALFPWLVATVGLIFVLMIGYQRLSTSTVGPQSVVASADSLGRSGSTTVATAPGSPLKLALDGEVILANGPADCATLDAPYFRDLCASLQTSDWRAIDVEGSGPSPQMYAKLLRATLANDSSICSDDSIIAFVEAGSRVDASTATRYCRESIARAWADGEVSIYDPTAVDGRHPLIVVVE